MTFYSYTPFRQKPSRQRTIDLRLSIIEGRKVYHVVEVKCLAVANMRKCYKNVKNEMISLKNGIHVINKAFVYINCNI